MAPSTRKKAAEAAHKLLGANIALIEELADADAEIDALDAEQQAHLERMSAARQVFKERYRTALGSWTDAQLADLGYRAARGGTPTPRGRRRSREPSGEGESAASSSPTAAAGDGDTSASETPVATTS